MNYFLDSIIQRSVNNHPIVAAGECVKDPSFPPSLLLISLVTYTVPQSAWQTLAREPLTFWHNCASHTDNSG